MLYYLSLLLFKGSLLLLNNLFLLWRALSNQAVPYQALRLKQEKTNYKGIKSESNSAEAPSHPPKVVFHTPCPNVHFHFPQLSAAIVCFTRKSPGSQTKCWCKIEPRSTPPPGLKKKNSRSPLTPPPPRAPPAGLFTSPTPPLVIRQQQGGGTSILSP